MNQIHKRLGELFLEVRPVAVNLVDSFDFEDDALRSTLGSYDGQVKTEIAHLK